MVFLALGPLPRASLTLVGYDHQHRVEDTLSHVGIVFIVLNSNSKANVPVDKLEAEL